MCYFVVWFWRKKYLKPYKFNPPKEAVVFHCYVKYFSCKSNAQYLRQGIIYHYFQNKYGYLEWDSISPSNSHL